MRRGTDVVQTRPIRSSDRSVRRWSGWVCLTIVALGTTAPLSAKRKDNALVLLNSDRLVGEIKELAQGES